MTDEDYDAHDDMWRSWDECLAAVRERMARGGLGWNGGRNEECDIAEKRGQQKNQAAASEQKDKVRASAVPPLS